MWEISKWQTETSTISQFIRWASQKKQVRYVAFTSDHKKQMTGPHVQFRYLKEKMELWLETRKPEAEEFHKELRNLR